MFRITGGRGFQITFDNGYIVSVQFGTGSYSSAGRGNNLNLREGQYNVVEAAGKTFLVGDLVLGSEGSETAEVAILDPNGKFIGMPGEDGDVKGHVGARELLGLMVFVEAL